jgi:hypothetical protein
MRRLWLLVSMVLLASCGPKKFGTQFQNEARFVLSSSTVGLGDLSITNDSLRFNGNKLTDCAGPLQALFALGTEYAVGVCGSEYDPRIVIVDLAGGRVEFEETACLFEDSVARDVSKGPWAARRFLQSAVFFAHFGSCF